MKILPVLLLCLPLWGHAEIYQWQDSNGNQHFTDRSHPQATVIDLKPGYGYYQIKRIYDGDTVELKDGRKVRLLGINTPEVRHKGKMADALGNEARQWLINKFETSKVRLVMDAEKTDKYGRTLAHLFSEKKDHINLQLVEAGLAHVYIYPPNLLYSEVLLKAEDKAEHDKLGIWQRNEYAVKPVDSLTKNGHAGWVRVAGNVTGIHQSRKFVYLEFSRLFEVRIERKWLILFPDVKEYLGKSVEARGWLNKNRGRFSMLIRHPSALKSKAS